MISQVNGITRFVKWIFKVKRFPPPKLGLYCNKIFFWTYKTVSLFIKASHEVRKDWQLSILSTDLIADCWMNVVKDIRATTYMTEYVDTA